MRLSRFHAAVIAALFLGFLMLGRSSKDPKLLLAFRGAELSESQVVESRTQRDSVLTISTATPSAVSTTPPTKASTSTPTAAENTITKMPSKVIENRFQDLVVRFPNVNESYLARCRKRPVPGPRKGNDCEAQLSLQPSVYPKPIVTFDPSKYHKIRFATFLVDTDWGFTCNKLEIVAGAIWKLKNTPGELRKNALAFGPVVSDMAWQLDLVALSKDFPVLLDCIECDKKDFIKCGTMVSAGHILDVSSEGLYPVETRLIDAQMYWELGPSVLGFHPALATNLIPSEVLRRSMERMMLGFRSQTLGVHRRDMEDYCYRYVGTGTKEYECHKSGEANEIINSMKSIDTSGKWAKKYFFKPLERQYPFLMTCNYTLDEEQLEIFRGEWPNVFKPGKKMHILFTTDGNDKGGDAIFKQSPIIDRLFLSKDIAPDVGCNRNKHRMLLYDMYGLALSDFHMSNPLSSCDVTVVHWRRMLGRGANSSYPQLCYNGYYEQNITGLLR